ncbi:hypothetical protein APHWI1_0648 [Anaplasma phagocytophilum str. ApWI1]|uniref:Uncharacterized protein n=1 Tax=Anaplasma phagocytophilum str. ApWI1 TaxID=1359155 RepID=A0A0F3Q0F0_ANAPH|nr:hypothetical protein APHWEB_0872 [Anaplasma phagocytophilum str. Webster]KJV85606.1 hypothetical protein APHWI1_0648 [Anaplasma phagocytophilum str. ApWI1]
MGVPIFHARGTLVLTCFMSSIKCLCFYCMVELSDACLGYLP